MGNSVKIIQELCTIFETFFKSTIIDTLYIYTGWHFLVSLLNEEAKELLEKQNTTNSIKTQLIHYKL